MKTILAALVIALSAFPDAARAGEAQCFEDWSVAAAIAAREKLVAVGQLQAGLPKGVSGAIVRTLLCQEGDRFVYRVLVRDRQGQMTKLTLEARRP